MLQTAKNFAGTFRSPKNYLTTVEYPEQKIPAKENARNFPFLVYDGEDPMDGLRCVACRICEKECPPQCIYIEKDKTKKPDFVGKLQFQPSAFDIDISVCMSCQICVEVCPFDAIQMDTEFELSQTDRFGGLLLDKRQLAKSNQYYRRIHPEEAAAIDVRRAVDVEKAKAKAAAKAQKQKSATDKSTQTNQ